MNHRLVRSKNTCVLYIVRDMQVLVVFVYMILVYVQVCVCFVCLSMLHSVGFCFFFPTVKLFFV